MMPVILAFRDRVKRIEHLRNGYAVIVSANMQKINCRRD